MTDRTVESIVAVTDRSAEQTRQWLADQQPIGRLITPEEVAESVWFCVQNGGMSGQGITVDGGGVQV